MKKMRKETINKINQVMLSNDGKFLYVHSQMVLLKYYSSNLTMIEFITSRVSEYGIAYSCYDPWHDVVYYAPPTEFDHNISLVQGVLFFLFSIHVTHLCSIYYLFRFKLEG